MKNALKPEGLAAHADEVRATVARNLDELLKAERWSRRRAAHELGLTHTYVNSRASGQTDLSASDIAMFADFLDVPVSRFFDPASDHDDDNVTPMPRRGGDTRRRSIYLLDGVGPAGIEPTTSTV